MENKFIQLTGKRESDGILLPVSRVLRWDMSDGRTMVVLFENRHRLEGFYVKESITEITAMLRSSITNVVSLHLVDEPASDEPDTEECSLYPACLDDITGW